VTGDRLQGDVETAELYREAAEKFEICHLHVSHRQPDRYLAEVKRSFGEILPQGHLAVVGLDGIAGTLIRMVTEFAEAESPWAAGSAARKTEKGKMQGLISWDIA